ncbi:MAG: polymer-forming cytoskeletal protein [Spirochaetales bacterium]|nr:polymer-forming cytoskeletal protein [Spirochaetales bacterium]
MKSKLLFLIILWCLFSFSLFSLEMKFTDKPESETRLLTEDYLFCGDQLDFDGQAEDLFFFGKRLNMKGDMTSGLLAFGENILIHGNVANDMIGGANKIIINGQVLGTLFLAGSEIHLNEESLVRGSLFAASGNLRLEGTLEGDLFAGSGVLYFDGVINGDVIVYAREMVFSDRAVINGNLTYHSDNALSEKEQSHVKGTVVYKQEMPFNWGSDFGKEAFLWINIFLTVLWFLSFVVIGLLILLFPVNRKINYVKSNKHFWSYLLWGLIPFLIYPVAVVLFMVLVITLPVGFMLLLAYLPLLVFTAIYGTVVLGEYLFRVFGFRSQNPFLYFLFGAAIFILLSLIPFIKVIIMVFVSSLGWGILIEKIFKRKLVASGNEEAEPDYSENLD